MRIMILTSSLEGFASVCLPRLAEAPSIQVALVLLSEGGLTRPGKARWNKIKKAVRIGVLGTFNGIRLRPWFKDDVKALLAVEPIDRLAGRLGIPFESTPAINCARTIELIKASGAELGLSLGNGYIGSRVFTVPKHGMLNVHHELLPEYQGAQSVIWQIYNGSAETGYTVHQVDRHIDTGAILYRQVLPIDLRPTLRETVSRSVARLFSESAAKLPEIVRDYTALSARAKAQSGGARYTTPTYWQYLRMVRRHRVLYRDRPR
jgi:methionyl-tRNA formyltransferase